MTATRLTLASLVALVVLLSFNAGAQGKDPADQTVGDQGQVSKHAVRTPGGTTGDSGGVAKHSARQLPPNTQSARSPGSAKAIASATPEGSGAPVTALDSMQSAVLERVNYHRTLAGLAPVAAEPRLLHAAQSHTSYLESTDTTGHYETVKTDPYYTGHSPFDRIDAAHYKYEEAGEVVALQPSTHPPAAVDALVTAIYHRFIILLSDVVQAGPGVTLNARGGAEELRVTVDFGAETLPSAPPSADLTIYPVDGHKNVRVDFDPSEEEPNPMPGHTLVGYPISVQVDPRHTLEVESFKLSRVNPGGSASALDTLLLQHAVNAETPAHAAALIPVSPLAHGATYRVSFAGSVSGAKISKTWQFTTAPDIPVTMSFGSPAVQPGGTQTVTLEGLDSDKGSYHVCYGPAQLVTSLKYETQSQLTMTIGPACEGGTTCEVHLVASYHSACATPFAQGSFTISR